MKFHQVDDFNVNKFLNVAQTDGALIARCGGLAFDRPKIGPEFATAPMVPSEADAPWFRHWHGNGIVVDVGVEM